MSESQFGYRSEEYGKQLIRFDGLLFRNNARPTDVDLLVDLGGNLFALGEFKHSDGQVPQGGLIPEGQKIALERLCKTLGMAVPTLLFEAHHATGNGEAIDAKSCDVHRLMICSPDKAGDWRPPNTKCSVEKLLNSWADTEKPVQHGCACCGVTHGKMVTVCEACYHAALGFKEAKP